MPKIGSVRLAEGMKRCRRSALVYFTESKKNGLKVSLDPFYRKRLESMSAYEFYFTTAPDEKFPPAAQQGENKFILFINSFVF